MTKTLTVVGSITAVDTRTLATAQGSVTAPSLVVPSGTKRIDKLILAAAQDGAAVGSGTFFVRLGGPGVLRGEQVLVISASGTIAVQSGSDQNYPVCRPNVVEDVDIEVSPGDTISVSVEMTGQDLGTASVPVTIVYG